MRMILGFEKTGALIYISHLDLQRTMHRTIKRAQLPVDYSKGFHPLPLVNFAHALGVGVSSVGEYMEITLRQPVAPDAVRDALNDHAPQGLRFTKASPVDEKSASLMALIVAAKWHLAAQVPQEALTRMMEQKEIVMERTTKHGTRMTDIRPGILELTAVQNGVEMLLAAGSTLNIRPTEVMVQLGVEGHLTRMELYAQKDGALLPLIDFIESEIF